MKNTVTLKEFLFSHSTLLSVKEVIDQIETKLQEKKVTVFARINHSQLAKDVGLTIPDEELLIFGNPKVGTPLMAESPAIGIELPLKILAWRADTKTIIAYQNLDVLAETFAIKTSRNTIKMLNDFLQNIVASVVK